MQHHHHHNPEWFLNEEKERPLNDIAERLISIGKKLKEHGECKLDKFVVKPSDSSWFVIRYERMPRGELSLKLEIMWDEDSVRSSSDKNKEDIIIS